MKKILFLFITIFLLSGILLQVSQRLFNILNFAPLGGYIEMASNPHLTVENFRKLTYQASIEKFVKQNAALYPLAIRTRNQIRYGIFKELQPGIEKGKNNYLFESLYIESLQGKNFIGKDSIFQLATHLKRIIDSLDQNYNKKFVVALTINKAFLHPDQLPSYIVIDDNAETNYKSYLTAFDRLQIPYIDFNSYFKEEIDHTKHQLTTKNGIHWSKYGALIAADSLNHSIGIQLKKKLNQIYFDSLIVTSIPEKEDVDIAQSLNLLQDLTPEKYTYAKSYLKVDSSSYKPKVLLIGDSFAWTIFNQYVPHEYWHAESNFLYYNKQLWQVSPTDLHGSWTTNTQRQQLIDSAEVIVLLYSPMNMNDFGSGFMEEN